MFLNMCYLYMCICVGLLAQEYMGKKNRGQCYVFLSSLSYFFKTKFFIDSLKFHIRHPNPIQVPVPLYLPLTPEACTAPN